MAEVLYTNVKNNPLGCHKKLRADLCNFQFLEILLGVQSQQHILHL